MNHQGTIKITTNRLILRPLQLNDAEAMYLGWATDLEVIKYLSWKPHLSVEETKRIISYWISNYPDPKFYIWGIQIINGPLIGTISIHSIHDGFERGEIGYALAKPYWNRGFVTEALQGLIDYAFGIVGFNRLEAHHALGNPASGRVLEKVGFQYEGLHRQYYRSNAGFQDAKKYALLKQDWTLTK
jgi:[ribosomal protein S5]-alanine N-acetyltransferase